MGSPLGAEVLVGHPSKNTRETSGWRHPRIGHFKLEVGRDSGISVDNKEVNTAPHDPPTVKSWEAKPPRMMKRTKRKWIRRPGDRGAPRKVHCEWQDWEVITAALTGQGLAGAAAPWGGLAGDGAVAAAHARC